MKFTHSIVVFYCRIVILASLGHIQAKIRWDDLNYEKSYGATEAYNNSKLANVLHSKELARRLQGSNINVYCLHPGIVNTEVFRHVDKKWYIKLFRSLGKPLFITPAQGAQTTLYCCLEDSIENESGEYYSNCKKSKANKRGRNEANQKRLWEISEQMVGLKNSQHP